MRALPATLPVLFLCEISFLLGHGLIMTLLGVRMSLEGFPSQMAGLLMSSFSLGFVAGSYWLEKRIRSVEVQPEEGEMQEYDKQGYEKESLGDQYVMAVRTMK